jgi:ribosome recycling factor
MIDDIKREAEAKMKKAVESLSHEMAKIRTGRANASLLDHVQVDYYGTLTPLTQLASITSGDSRTLIVTPWEKAITSAIEKAILTSDLGLNPSTNGAAIRVPMPALTEERRKEMIRIVRGEAEQGRISIRNLRRDANSRLKDLLKEKAISEDDDRRGSDQIQKITDKFIAEVEQVLLAKEKDLMQI